MSPEIVAQIDSRLKTLCSDHNVSIPLAIESGSRAWGFPSPDSDYDCRFIFVRSMDALLSPWPERDVIETPIDAIFDISGWDLGKAIKLMLGGNAVAIEWLTSPIYYRSELWFREGLLRLAQTHADRSKIARHYLHLGKSQWEKHVGSGSDVQIKSLFYFLRPAIALRWLRCNPLARVSPMNLSVLIENCDLDRPLVALINDLIAQKALAREKVVALVPVAILTLAHDEFLRAETNLAAVPPQISPNAINDANAFFRAAVKRCNADIRGKMSTE